MPYTFSLNTKFKFVLQNKKVLEDNGKFIISEEKDRSYL